MHRLEAGESESGIGTRVALFSDPSSQPPVSSFSLPALRHRVTTQETYEGALKVISSLGKVMDGLYKRADGLR